MTDPKHPLIATYGSHAFPNLVGQRLKPQLVIGGCQRARQRVTRAALLLVVDKAIKCFAKAGGVWTVGAFLFTVSVFATAITGYWLTQ